MGDFLIDRTELENAKSQGNGEPVISALLIPAGECISNGGKVIIERRYSNAPPDRIEEFASLGVCRA